MNVCLSVQTAQMENATAKIIAIVNQDIGEKVATKVWSVILNVSVHKTWQLQLAFGLKQKIKNFICIIVFKVSPLIKIL